MDTEVDRKHSGWPWVDRSSPHTDEHELDYWIGEWWCVLFPTRKSWHQRELMHLWVISDALLPSGNSQSSTYSWIQPLISWCILLCSASVADKTFEDKDSVDGGLSSSSSSSKAPPSGRKTVVSSVRRPSSATTAKSTGEQRHGSAKQPGCHHVENQHIYSFQR